VGGGNGGPTKNLGDMALPALLRMDTGLVFFIQLMNFCLFLVVWLQSGVRSFC